MDTTSLEGFYKEFKGASSLIPEGISKEIGHFNVFKIDELMRRMKEKPGMPYNRRTYYKISLISGRNKAEYADKVIDIEKNALLFATPKVPYHWIPQDEDQHGYFCIFTDDFLSKSMTGLKPDELPIFQPGAYPIFQLTDEAAEEIRFIFTKMSKELSSDYSLKYDLIRNYVLELIHYGQKLQPASALYPTHSFGKGFFSVCGTPRTAIPN